jgi:hypothetical protein
VGDSRLSANSAPGLSKPIVEKGADVLHCITPALTGSSSCGFVPVDDLIHVVIDRGSDADSDLALLNENIRRTAAGSIDLHKLIFTNR